MQNFAFMAENRGCPPVHAYFKGVIITSAEMGTGVCLLVTGAEVARDWVVRGAGVLCNTQLCRLREV